MRVDNHIHIRHVMLYHFKKGMKPADSWRDLNEVFRKGTIGKRTMEAWFVRFKSGDTNLVDKEGRARPMETDEAALLEVVEKDKSLTTRMLAENFGVNQPTMSGVFVNSERCGNSAGKCHMSFQKRIRRFEC